MANTDFSVLLKAVLDKTGINSELEQVQKIVNKYSIDIMPELKTASLRNQIKDVSQEIANDFNKAFGTNLTGKDVFRAYENQAKQVRLETKQLYDDIVKTGKQLNTLQTKQVKLDPNINSKEWNELSRQITEIQSKYDSLMNDFWSKDQKTLSMFNVADLQTLQEMDYTLSQTKAKMQDTSAQKNAKQSYDEIFQTLKQLNGLQTQQAKLDPVGDLNKWKVLDSEIQSVSEKYEKLLSEFWSTPDIDKYFNIGDFSKLDAEVQKTANSMDMLNAKKMDGVTDEVKKIQHSLNAEKYAADITKINNELNKVGKYTLSDGNNEQVFNQAQVSAESLLNTYNQLKMVMSDTSGKYSDTQKIETEKQYQQALEKTKNLLSQINLSKDDELVSVTDSRRTNMIANLNNYLSKNTAMTKASKAEIKSWIATLSSSGDITVGTINDIDSKFKQLDASLRATGKLGLSVWDKFKQAFQKFGGWTLVSGAMMRSITSIKKAIDNVVDLDDKLLELNKVSDLSANRLEKVTEEAYELGEQVGKTGTQVIEAITNFKRAGFELDESTKLAETALKMTNVAEGIDEASESAQYLISIMKGYGDTSDGFATKILDSVNEVSNTQAIDFDNLVDGAQNLSAVANQAKVSFDEMLGILTGGYEVLGDMSKVSNGMITIFSRLQAIQLEGEEEVSTVAKLQETFSNATGGVVNIVDKTTGQLRSAYDILDDIADIWDKLDSNTQSALATEAAGIRQKNTFLSVIENWESVEKSVESASDSIGSAEVENAKYLDSISGKISQFHSATEQLSSSLTNSETIKFFVDLGTIGVKSLDLIINKYGTLNTITTIGAGVLGAKGLGLTNYVTQS